MTHPFVSRRQSKYVTTTTIVVRGRNQVAMRAGRKSPCPDCRVMIEKGEWIWLRTHEGERDWLHPSCLQRWLEARSYE